MNGNQDIKRLYRSDDDRIIAGVCGGIGEYFSIDPVLIRIIGVVSLFVHGAGVIVYILAWLLIPRKPLEYY